MHCMFLELYICAAYPASLLLTLSLTPSPKEKGEYESRL